jgi:hypothetical protein
MNDEWLNTTVELVNAKPLAVKELLDSLARTIEEAPSECRYDVTIEVDERE